MELFPTWTLTLLLGIIVILVVFLNTNLKEKKSESHDKAFQHFLEEWQKENEALLGTLAEMQSDVMERLDDVQERVRLLESKAHDRDVAGTETDFRNRYSDIFEMADNGMSVADIARKTGRGNGEIQLILGLAARRTAHD